MVMVMETSMDWSCFETRREIIER